VCEKFANEPPLADGGAQVQLEGASHLAELAQVRRKCHIRYPIVIEIGSQPDLLAWLEMSAGILFNEGANFYLPGAGESGKGSKDREQ
jgi:hypothetical protein